jgi:oxygen-dependent protoporphyrinogen oxidase
VRGALAAALDRGRPRGLSGSWSAQDGLGGLARALAARLGERLVRGARVARAERDGGGFRLALAGGGEIRARALVLALPAWAAADVARGLDAELADGLARVEYAPLASVSVSVAPDAPLRGFGFLVPRGEGVDLLGALFMSRVFPGRAPAGRELVTGLLGGLRWPGAADAADDELLGRLGRGLELALGLRDAAEPLAVTRWPRAVPQPGRDHPALVARLRERAAGLGALRLAGGYLDGIGVSDALISGARAAREL